MNNTTRQECAACIASCRMTVDAFFLGFRAGFRSAVVAQIEGRGEVTDIEAPRMCTAHESMATEAYAAELRACMGMEPR